VGSGVFIESKYALTDSSILDPISFISSSCFLSSLNFVFALTLSYICAACLFKEASGISFNCFLSVIGAVLQEVINKPQLQVPNISRNCLC